MQSHLVEVGRRTPGKPFLRAVNEGTKHTHVIRINTLVRGEYVYPCKGVFLSYYADVFSCVEGVFIFLRWNYLTINHHQLKQ